MTSINVLPFKKLAILAVLAVALYLIAPKVLAADLNSQHDLCTGANLSIQESGAGCGKVSDGHGGFKNETAGTDDAESKFTKIIKDFLNIVSVIVGIATVIMIIYGGFRFVTSAGNPESTKTAKNAILYAIIGLLIVAFAQVIVKFILIKIG